MEAEAAIYLGLALPCSAACCCRMFFCYISSLDVRLLPVEYSRPISTGGTPSPKFSFESAVFLCAATAQLLHGPPYPLECSEMFFDIVLSFLRDAGLSTKAHSSTDLETTRSNADCRSKSCAHLQAGH